MKPEHLALYRQPGTPAPHPSGNWAAVAIARPDLDADTYPSSLWHLTLDTGALQPLTTGEVDSSPAMSPDGNWFAFLRSTGGKPPQLHISRVDAAGICGEPQALTDHPLGVGGPIVFSESRIAYTAPVPEDGRYGTDTDVSPGAEPPRHITDLTYRRDGIGFYLDRPTHIFTIDLDDVARLTDPLADAPEPKADKPALGGTGITPHQLTSGDDGFANPFWSGENLLAGRANRNALHTTFVRITPNGETADISIPRFEAEGASGRWTVFAGAVDVSEADKVWLLVADYGPDRMDFIGRAGALASARLDGSELREFTVHTDPRTDQLGGIVFDTAADGVYVTREYRGTIQLMRYDGALTPVIDGEVAVTSGRAIPSGGALAVAEMTDSVGDVVHVLPAETASEGELATVRTLTDLSARLREEAGVFEPEEVTIIGPDEYPVHGWVTTPLGEGPHPVLLLIHGGPHAAYTPTFFDEVQVYTEAGYAVAFCNPRGSSSYGQDHGRAITGGWGNLDAQDVLAFFDGVLAERDELDSSRVGVLGGSYGGYMTAWLTIQDDRWKGAIVERGFVDAFSFEGSSDIGWFFGVRYLGEDLQEVAAQNPMSHIDKVTTPTLVIHSEEDWRCPVEQGQRWFVGLKRRGVGSELLLFSGEGHELSRSGKPKHRLARFEHILRWWNTYLPVTE